MDIEEYLEKTRKKINSYLEILLSPIKENSILYAAMSYGLLAPGKRIRPILLIATYESNDNEPDKILPFAAAIEMIHTYSLIHDDLPIMDNSDLRRGRPTCHKIYGSDMALLAGDALLTYAFEVITSQHIIKDFDNETLVKVVNEYSKASGFRGLVGGQVMDMVTLSEENISEDAILYIEKRKTAALIALPIKIGGIISKLENTEIESLARFGEYLGISYQIQDDILDASSTKEEIGKDIGQDVKNKKASFVYLYGVEKASQIAKQYTKKAIDFIKPYEKKYDLLIQIAQYLEERKR